MIYAVLILLISLDIVFQVTPLYSFFHTFIIIFTLLSIAVRIFLNGSLWLARSGINKSYETFTKEQLTILIKTTIDYIGLEYSDYVNMFIFFVCVAIFILNGYHLLAMLVLVHGFIQHLFHEYMRMIYREALSVFLKRYAESDMSALESGNNN